MRRNYYIVILAVGLLAAVCLMTERSAVDKIAGLRSETSRELIELHLWHPWANEMSVYRKPFLEAVQEYNEKQNEIQVIPEGTETELYGQKLPSAIASNDTPDIYFCYTDTYLETIVNAGKVLKLNDYLSSDLSSQLQMNSLESMTFDGGIYGLSFAKSAGVFLVNRELFDKYDCDIPHEWEELLEICQVFLDNGVTPFACSGDSDTGFRLYLETLCLGQAKSSVCSNVLEGKVRADEAFLEGVRRFSQLAELGAFGLREPLCNTRDIETEFFLSRIPMYLTKNKFVGNIILQNSPLYGKIDVVTFPGSDDGELLGGIEEAFVINRTTKYPGEAAGALEEILLGFSVKLYESGAGIPAWNINGAKAVESRLYSEVYRMVNEADSYLPYWEISLERRRAKDFMESSKELFLGKRTPEEFAEVFD